MTTRERQDYKEWIQTQDNEIEQELSKAEEQEVEEGKTMESLHLKDIVEEFFIPRPGYPN